jgi:hypothetical protein
MNNARRRSIRTSDSPLSRTSSTRKSPDLSYPAWQAEYNTALLELEPSKLSTRVEEAEAAIFKRLQALSESRNGQDEHQAIQAAVAALRVIKRNRLAFPEW